MKIAFNGHAVVQIATNNGVKIIIDPFINGNPSCNLTVDKIKVDYVLLTHAHADHFGDTLEIAKSNQATVVANPELCDYLQSQGIEDLVPMQAGQTHDFDFGRLEYTPAIHGSSLTIDGEEIQMGKACGIILDIEGKTVYHMGDTHLFPELQALGENHAIDLAFAPIGGKYTMDAADAKTAVETLNAKKVIPVHYNTFEGIEADPNAFVASLPEGVGFIPIVGEFFTL